MQDMYRESKSFAGSTCGDSETFQVRIGVHQGSALSPVLFLLVVDALTSGIQREAPFSMLFADDVDLCGDSKQKIENDFRLRTECLGEKWLKTKQAENRGHD